MNCLEYKGYRGSIEYSRADKCYHGKVMGMKGILINYEGDTLDELRKDFEDGIDDYLEGLMAEGIIASPAREDIIE
ncbi:MAG: hypothetical protein LUC49_04410 [Prevotella sp.]|nr:hypothetical protein [Prevotella sp.]